MTPKRRGKKMRYRNIVLIILLAITILVWYKIQRGDNILYIYPKECNGSSNQNIINRKLSLISKSDKYSTLYLKGEGECIIDEPIIVPSGTKLLGDHLFTIKLKDNLNWQKYKPVIGQYGVEKWTPFGDRNSSIENIEIGGFRVDVGSQRQPAGKGYFPIILLYNPKNIEIHNLVLKNSRWDSIRLSNFIVRGAIDAKIDHNRIFNSGHEGISIIKGSEFSIFKNEIINTRTNCGIRLKNCNRFKIYKNIIGNTLGKEPSGYAGILIENRGSSINRAEIFNNLIYGKNGGIVLDGRDREAKGIEKSGVYIYKNIIYHPKQLLVNNRSLSGGIRIEEFNNTLIEKNLIEGSFKDGVIYKGKSENPLQYQTILRENTIIDSRGFAINNSVDSKNRHRFILDRNLLYGNRENYFNTSSISDIYHQPKFKNPHTIENSWHHIALTYSSKSGVVKLYIDGEKRISRKFKILSNMDNIHSSNRQLFIGSYRGIAHWFRGEMALTIFNRELNRTEIQKIYKSHRKRNSYDRDIEIINLKTTLFSKENRYIEYKLSISKDFTISTWLYSMSRAVDMGYHTILNIGREESQNYIWLYIREDTLFINLKSGKETLKINSPILDLKNIFNFNFK